MADAEDDRLSGDAIDDGPDTPLPDGFAFAAMTLADVAAVHQVELRSFALPWTADAFEQELSGNAFALYVVLKHGTRGVGYGGMWLILDEAHVTNVAIDPDYRGQGLGEHLMWDLIHRARQRGATRMTLEVRVTNYVAQNLYAKLNFRGCGFRKGYYSDTGEDALIMWRDPL